MSTEISKENFAQLVQQHAPQVLDFTTRLLSDRREAEEVAQDAFVKAFRQLSSFRGDSSFVTWVQRIAYHEALYHLRKRKRQVMLPLNISDDVPDELPEDTTAQQLDEAIQQLSPEDQMLLQLFYFDGRSLKEIAYITDKAGQATAREVSRLSSQLHRIRQRLRIILTHTLKL